MGGSTAQHFTSWKYCPKQKENRSLFTSYQPIYPQNYTRTKGSEFEKPVIRSGLIPSQWGCKSIDTQKNPAHTMSSHE